jgi:thiosulfate dehydrogenase [quinone] large subunit
MLMFGWQGATCIDEWTMAASNLAMGATLMLAGSSAFSLDNVLLSKKPGLVRRGWFRWMAGSLPLPLSDRGFRTVTLAVLGLTVIFNMTTYSYYRGSVLTAFHSGPVSPTIHHLTLSDGTLAKDGSVRFHAYLDGGTPEAPSNIMKAELLASDGTILAQWDETALSHLAPAAIANDFLYNRFVTGPFGLSARMGAAATITLPTVAAAPLQTSDNVVKLRLMTVNGHRFDELLSVSR